MTLYRFYLTTEERQILEGWRQKYKLHSPKLRQIQILLNNDEHTGRWATIALVAVLGTSTKTVERAWRQFCEAGLALFAPKVRKTRSDKKIDGRVEAHLTALVCQSPPDEAPAWHLQVLADRLVELEVVEHILTTMVARLLKKRTQTFPPADPVGDSGRTKRRLCLPDGAGARAIRAALRRRLSRRMPGRVPQVVD